MPYHAEKRIVPYSADLLYSVVADVEKYPEFLPWCSASRVYNRQGDRFDADLVIAYKHFRERFTSRVTVSAGKKVDVDYLRGPMKQLYNHWRFIPIDDQSCEVDFEVDFAFRSKMLTIAIGPMFTKATRKMMEAFENRASDLQNLSI